MKFYDNGAFYTVEMSVCDVTVWARNWPCFGSERAMWFQFGKRNGDLVDMSDSDGLDESGVVALSHYAQKWAQVQMEKLDGW